MSNDKKDAMPEWPDEFRDDFNWPLAVHYEQAFEHERALCAAWEARCRKLQKACIRFMASDIANKHKDYGCVDAIAEALEAVGKPPPSSERG